MLQLVWGICGDFLCLPMNMAEVLLFLFCCYLIFLLCFLWLWWKQLYDKNFNQEVQKRWQNLKRGVHGFNGCLFWQRFLFSCIMYLLWHGVLFIYSPLWQEHFCLILHDILQSKFFIFLLEFLMCDLYRYLYFWLLLERLWELFLLWESE